MPTPDEDIIRKSIVKANRLAIWDDIMRERDCQDAKWGGPLHDDQHDSEDWHHFIVDHSWRAQDAIGDQPGHRREQLIRVAALAVAAIESLDRQVPNA